ncbi:serine/threonine protein kinase [Aromatoleum bremense]|uniref:Stress response kinase A n=1 Tax=Aromatoleum bremense TaxID=76115 RepID=A0ABX1NVC9_9RHOO|nr:serine/threonine protein kinase [Aromatoleum bremense]NMG15974.1 serine/threonine protein kinase [Aromatoleum bremense]QTQ33724.1 putative stress response kinase A [Aromatoleum bremense]
MATPPFENLTPDRILDALDSVGLIPDGRLLTLNSYENRVYQAGIEDGPMVVVKFYRPRRWPDEAIGEEHRFVAELAEREIPVVAPLVLRNATLHHHADLRFAVFPRVGGRAPELSDAATLEWMGRFLGRIHAVGALAPYHARPTLDIASFGEEPRDWLLANGFIPDDLLPAWRSTVEQALDGVRRCFDRAGAFTPIRLHGDCHGGNVLWSESPSTPGPQFVDFDDSRMGPAVQDLWMLLSGTREDMSRQLGDVLAGYEDFHDFSLRELHLIEALRTLRLIHYSAWIARRWDDPAFPAAFPWFNTQRYWQDRILELREQIPLMDERPLWST